MVTLENIKAMPAKRRCGHVAEEAYFVPVPLPKRDEMIHASEGKSVLFIWRDRWFDHGVNEPDFDRRHVCMARMDLGGPGNNARILVISTFAVDNPTWVTSIVKSMGFDYEIAVFGSYEPHEIPVELWEMLREAVLCRVNNKPLPSAPPTVTEYVAQVKK